MKFDMNQEGTRLTVNVEGELDVRTSPELEKELMPALEGITEAVIDLKEVTYLSSAGLRTLLSAAKLMDRQGKVVVKNVSNDVMEILKITGFDSLLTLE